MSVRHARNRRAIAASTAIGLVLTLVACTSSAEDSSASASRLTEEGRVSYLQLGDFGGGSNPKINYNPYSATALGPLWTMYEQLYVVNSYDCTEVPWLATGYEWTSPTELHLTTREGVTWHDGEDFTAHDVAFTLSMLLEHPALDKWGAGQGMTSAQALSDTEVVVTFDEPAVVRTQKVLEVLVVPEHIWSQVDDPVTYVAEDGVGTGPFVAGTFNPQRMTVVRNPDYWRAEDVKIDELRFDKSDAGGQVDQLKLARGEFDVNSMYIPDIDSTYVAKDPENNHYWFPSGSPISLFMNLTQAPFDDVEFRRAISSAIDKDRLVEDAGEGYVNVASQTLLVLPGQRDWLDPTIADDGVLPYDAQAAADQLTAAGYELDASGRRLGKDGQPLRFTFITPQGWNDWTAAANSVVDDLKALGLDVALETPAYEVLEQDRLAGNFDLTFGVRGGSCSMYKNYDEPLASANSAPIGERAVTNEIRWEDPETDALLAQLAGTAEAEAQKPIVHELQQIMMDEVPFIPLWYGGKWFEFSTRHVTGWPSAENPYAGPDNGWLIFTTLTPTDAD